MKQEKMNKIVKDAQQKLENAKEEILKALEEELNRVEQEEKMKANRCVEKEDKKSAPRKIINIAYKMKEDGDMLDGAPMVTHGDSINDAEACLAIVGGLAAVIHRGLGNEVSYDDIYNAVSAAMPNVFMSIIASVIGDIAKERTQKKSMIDDILDSIFGGN